MKPSLRLMLFMSLMASQIIFVSGNENAKRLYDDLMVRYNRHRRPTIAPNQPTEIRLRMRLSQIIDLHEIDQIMTCSVWLRQQWFDRKLSWEPAKYGGVSILYVPYEMIWVPDIVLYNSADSNFNITISTKAALHYSGEVTWEPPAIFRSLCQINVQWFPFDEQQCYLKFGSWTYSDNLLRLELSDVTNIRYDLEMNELGQMQNVTIVEDGIDLTDYYPSVEWDIMSRVAKRRSKTYPSCCAHGEFYTDIMYYLELRRKPLFYTVNLVFPCVFISLLTITVFYLPSECGEKITLCISILVSLTFFLLLLLEIIPATSIVLPLIGKYLLFTMLMVSLSVFVTVIVLNVHWRTPTTHKMPDWVKWLFLRTLPKILLMRRPLSATEESFRRVADKKYEGAQIALAYHEHRVSVTEQRRSMAVIVSPVDERLQALYKSPAVVKAFENICFVAELLKKKDRNEKIDEDWKYVAKVLDRVFLIIFSIACLTGTIFILLKAPTLYDNRQAIDLRYRPDPKVAI